jgi:hypothetical protein
MFALETYCAQRRDAQCGDAQRGDVQRGNAQRGNAQRGEAQRGDAQRGDAERGHAGVRSEVLALCLHVKGVSTHAVVVLNNKILLKHQLILSIMSILE